MNYRTIEVRGGVQISLLTLNEKFNELILFPQRSSETRSFPDNFRGYRSEFTRNWSTLLVPIPDEERKLTYIFKKFKLIFILIQFLKCAGWEGLALQTKFGHDP